ncbi:hypothetical protein RHSIM_Rhsim11G0033000 [Rhododendron simsii]|uniref:Uncharacterized protein n=1 Tax=Rhododendron simsii TaxID=118357 RepID=A0A834GC07_RHOSS|nr:hypothetical protein RHSIM_Rhsim11G0033000 [Rhododendron simsii]
MDQHDPIEVNDQQFETEPDLLVVVQHDLMEINEPQPAPEAEPPVAMELIETYEHLRVEVIDLFQMLKVTRSSSQHLALALKINPSLRLLRQFAHQVEEQIKANIQQELEEFEQNKLWNEIAIHEIAIPWAIDKPTISSSKPLVLKLHCPFKNSFPDNKLARCVTFVKP